MVCVGPDETVWYRWFPLSMYVYVVSFLDRFAGFILFWLYLSILQPRACQRSVDCFPSSLYRRPLHAQISYEDDYGSSQGHIHIVVGHRHGSSLKFPPRKGSMVVEDVSRRQNEP